MVSKRTVEKDSSRAGIAGRSGDLKRNLLKSTAKTHKTVLILKFMS